MRKGTLILASLDYDIVLFPKVLVDLWPQGLGHKVSQIALHSAGG